MSGQHDCNDSCKTKDRSCKTELLPQRFVLANIPNGPSCSPNALFAPGSLNGILAGITAVVAQTCTPMQPHDDTIELAQQHHAEQLVRDEVAPAETRASQHSEGGNHTLA